MMLMLMYLNGLTRRLPVCIAGITETAHGAGDQDDCDVYVPSNYQETSCDETIEWILYFTDFYPVSTPGAPGLTCDYDSFGIDGEECSPKYFVDPTVQLFPFQGIRIRRTTSPSYVTNWEPRPSYLKGAVRTHFGPRSQVDFDGNGCRSGLSWGYCVDILQANGGHYECISSVFK